MEPKITLTLPANENGCYQLPTAERISGLLLFPDQDPLLSTVRVQIGTGQTPQPLDLAMPLREAMRLSKLLNLLCDHQGLQAMREALDI